MLHTPLKLDIDQYDDSDDTKKTIFEPHASFSTRISLISKEKQMGFVKYKARRDALSTALRTLPDIVKKRKWVLYSFRGVMLIACIGVSIYWIIKKTTHQACEENVDHDFFFQKMNLTSMLKTIDQLEEEAGWKNRRIWEHFLHDYPCTQLILSSSLCHSENPCSYYKVWSYPRLCTNMTAVNEALDHTPHKPWQYCYPHKIEWFCEVDLDLLNLRQQMEILKNIANQLRGYLETAINEANLLCDQAYYSPFQNPTFFYFVLVGFGEISPVTFLLLTLLSNVVSYSFAKIPSLNFSEDERNSLSSEESQLSNTDASSLLIRYEKERNLIDQKLFLHRCRHTFFMATKEHPTLTPAATLLKGPTSEPKLASVIFEFAGLNEMPPSDAFINMNL